MPRHFGRKHFEKSLSYQLFAKSSQMKESTAKCYTHMANGAQFKKQEN